MPLMIRHYPSFAARSLFSLPLSPFSPSDFSLISFDARPPQRRLMRGMRRRGTIRRHGEGKANRVCHAPADAPRIIAALPPAQRRTKQKTDNAAS
jgi:hypothetical protein